MAIGQEASALKAPPVPPLSPAACSSSLSQPPPSRLRCNDDGQNEVLVSLERHAAEGDMQRFEKDLRQVSGIGGGGARTRNLTGQL
jgi:hypothetical protein